MEKLQPLLELTIQHSILSFFTQFVTSKATQKVLQVADKISNCFCILLYCSSEILPCHNFTTWFQALLQTFCCYFHSTGLFIHKQIYSTQPKFSPQMSCQLDQLLLFCPTVPACYSSQTWKPIIQTYFWILAREHANRRCSIFS